MKVHRYTNIQSAIINEMMVINHPVTITEINQALKYIYSFSSLFRNILLFEKSGVIIRVDRRERGSRYELSNLPHHHHISCIKCGAIVDVSDEDLMFNTSNIEKKTGYYIKSHTVEMRGVCSGCRN